MTSFYEYTSGSLGHKLNKSARLITHKLVRNFRESDIKINAEQWKILLYLYQEDGQTQTSLAESTGKDEPSVSRIVNTMEKFNLVFRTRHPSDRRTNLIFLTENGRDMRETLMSMGKKTNREVTEGIALQEIETCIRVLDKVIENLS
ncbi:MarR family transcriptional regulator [Desulfitobacterium sp. LBE]|uniref:Transcriptional regulator, MarR family n=2 Tax=root TaxID=1 RepID=B8G0W5_DESHD|nr:MULTISPECIES: MarR family winged helix-turn-helix transcriptional regulator [Desulfitobacterium]ACL18384.1 transcriptional regulator, MarR family [Desulfitobacterium hafniense DCB-2]MEA5023672.1 MarR family winged helix-turn-helix transcriptional regulator [Desulfitobacterium hafniense]TWH58688.1 MarR family transcriptional regulator [Desulfitobacterium sp. LBE]